MNHVHSEKLHSLIALASFSIDILNIVCKRTLLGHPQILVKALSFKEEAICEHHPEKLSSLYIKNGPQQSLNLFETK